MKCIIYKNKVGGVCIVYPVFNCGLSFEEIVAKDVPAGVEYKIIENNLIPKDGVFRDAWEFGEEAIEINMEKAKETWKNIWRNVRKPILEKLDLEWMRAMEIGNTSKSLEVSQKKQELRDVTNIDLSSICTIEDLKKIWPNCLE